MITKEKLILGEYSVSDKYGFFGNLEKFFSLWGTNITYSEYINANNAENPSTALYTLNILFDLKAIKYNRNHQIFLLYLLIFFLYSTLYSNILNVY